MEIKLRVKGIVNKVFGGSLLRRMRVSVWPYRIPRLILGVIFVWAGSTKLLAPGAFAQLISEYGLVPGNLLPAVADGLPVLELIAGLGIIFDLSGCLEVTTALIVMFIGVLWFGILKGLDVDCGCFSPDELRQYSGLRHALYRDFLFLLLAGYLFWWRWMYVRTQKV